MLRGVYVIYLQNYPNQLTIECTRLYNGYLLSRT